VLGFLRRLLRPKPLIILDVVATAVPQSRTIFCHEWCAFSALLCAQGFGRYSAGYWPHACHLNNTGARLHKQHNGPGDRLQYHVVPVSNFNVTEPSYPSHSLAWLGIPGRRIAKLELLSLDIFTQLL